MKEFNGSLLKSNKRECRQELNNTVLKMYYII